MRTARDKAACRFACPARSGWRLWWALIAPLWLAACNRSAPPVVYVVATPTEAPAATTTPLATRTPTLRPTPTPSATPAGWESVAEGAQVRRLYATQADRGSYVYALRLDPSRTDIALRYDPDRPRSVSAWLSSEHPIAAVNAGFFTRDYAPAGVWMIDGDSFGLGHELMEAELLVTGAGIYILRLNERYKADRTRTIAAVESYPLLIYDRRIARSIRDSSVAARTVVGLDGGGFVVFVLVPGETLTLQGLAEWLARSDLNLDVALNLDGGSSAGMLVQAGSQVWGADSGRDIPGVLVVYPKILGVTGGVP